MAVSAGGKGLAALAGIAILTLILVMGLHDRSLRQTTLGIRGRVHNDSPDQDPGDQTGDTLGHSIQRLAQNVEVVHGRIQRLGSKLGGVTIATRPSAPNGRTQQTETPELRQLPARNRPTEARTPPPFINLDESIFVSVASYRDEQCAPTIYDMYQKAANPAALFLGVVEQHDNHDPDCIPKEFRNCQLLAFCPSDQIQVRRIEPRDARGPTYGRYLGMLMYRGERYYMMIDSHNRFVTHWDRVVIDMYNSLPTKKSVLSHYPEAWNNPDDGGPTNAPLDNRQTTTYLCTAKFVEMGYPRLDGFIVHRTTKPREQPWAAAGFLFADAKLIKEVPFDPHLHFVFDGEEILYSVRMWTHGWDIYSPSQNILYHYYYRTKAKKFWGLLPADWTRRRDGAHRRIQWYLAVLKPGTTERLVPVDTTEPEVLVDREKYGLGTERSLEAYWKYAGVDMKERKIENKFCPRA